MKHLCAWSQQHNCGVFLSTREALCDWFASLLHNFLDLYEKLLFCCFKIFFFFSFTYFSLQLSLLYNFIMNNDDDDELNEDFWGCWIHYKIIFSTTIYKFYVNYYIEEFSISSLLKFSIISSGCVRCKHTSHRSEKRHWMMIFNFRNKLDKNIAWLLYKLSPSLYAFCGGSILLVCMMNNFNIKWKAKKINSIRIFLFCIKSIESLANFFIDLICVCVCVIVVIVFNYHAQYDSNYEVNLHA